MRATRRTNSPCTFISAAALAGAIVALCLAALPCQAAEDSAEAEPAPAALSLEAIQVTPENPEADTLCQLSVKIKNHGERPVSGLGFEVQIAGRPLTVYANQLFYQLLPAGAVTEVALFNFWTTETGRPAPADGKLPVAVTLKEATWMEVSTDKEGVEVWKVLEPVPGLPASKTLPLSLPKAKGEAEP
jgi:hypothetical protein